MSDPRKTSLKYIELFTKGLAEGTAWALSVLVIILILRACGVEGISAEVTFK